MAQNPDITQIAGNHFDTYEAYYKSLDPKGMNNIGAMDAAKFLKKSGLSDVVLSRVWDLSDPSGRGALDKRGFFVALKLVALAQMGERIDVKNLAFETNAPKCGDVPKIKPPPVPKMSAVAPPGQTQDWSVKPDEKQKYVNLFNSMQPENGQLPGGKVVGLLKESKLPVETLSQIWELADQDKDGSLDEHEFIVAMHLVYKALDRRAIPSTLPKELQKGFLKSEEISGGFVANFEMASNIVPVAPVIPAPSRPPQPGASIPSIPAPSSAATGDWVLTTVEKLKYQELFEKCDLDRDGMVSGVEIKDVFLKSGLQTQLLAHVWALCDTDQSGKLSNEQFALACWFIDRKKKGIDPPLALTPEMVPPSMRPNAAAPAKPPRPAYSNPELEMIAKEIEELARERHTIEAEVAQKEADIRIKSGEIRSLQSELDTLTATLKQLESQKDAAGKKLEELKATVNKLREQCQKQEETIKEQESELNSRKEELQKLKEEEDEVQKEYETSLNEKEKISKDLSDTQLQISQVRSMITQVEEVQRQMNDALALCKSAVEENNVTAVSEYSLNIEPDFRDIRAVLMSPEEKPKTPETKQDTFKPTTTNFEDSFDNKTGFADDDSWNTNNSWNAPPKNDPFASSTTPYDPPSNNSKDDFGSDPFAALHAPPKGSVIEPDSPSPALPPKAKGKPPRPAPPRPSQGPKIDSFGSSSFANFDDFDNKAINDSAPPKLPAKRVVVAKVDNTENLNSQQVPVANDFKEDPFQNYRYEDPFMIDDPFQDEQIEKKTDKELFDDITSSFDKFAFDSDPFNNAQPLPPPKKNATNGGSNNNIDFDAFGFSRTTATQDPFGLNNGPKATDSSGFGFEADFANFDAFNGNENSNKITKTTNGDFDAWGEGLDKQNNNFSSATTGKIKSSKGADVKKIRKFSADYSDNFDVDVNEVLKRSMVDQ